MLFVTRELGNLMSISEVLIRKSKHTASPKQTKNNLKKSMGAGCAADLF